MLHPFVAAVLVSGCSIPHQAEQLPPAQFARPHEQPSEQYRIGPYDELSVFVWRNPELSAKIQVRPDGRITTPLVSEMVAAGKTPTMLAEDIKLRLTEYIENPLVSVIVTEFAGTSSQQIRVIGATKRPVSIPYRANMTLLDAMIAAGGLSDFAAGNRARLIRFDDLTGRQTTYGLRLDDLLNDGDGRANVILRPGDVILIPESMF